jgi:hypothetical protein
MSSTIITKNSSTVSAVPSAGSLVKGELAVNVTDRKIYTKDASGNVVLVASSSSLGDGVTLTGTETLTNKTLVDPKISLGGTNGSSDQALVSAGAGVAPTWQTLNSLQAIASGSLPNGSTVVVNADGTVSVVSSGTVAGSTVSLNSSNTGGITATYDSTTQKVVFAYRDFGNSSFGTAIVGTVSGTSISFGTPVVFNSSNSFNISVTYNSAAQKVVIAYSDGGVSSYGYAIVGTVSGTSISFGTAAVFESSPTSNISATYDATTQKVVIAYAEFVSPFYGKAIVGTVSGTSISFGTAVVFESATTINISATYDSTTQKVVIAYRDSGNSGFGTAIVGTVSGTSISFGTAVVFNSTATNSINAIYASDSQKIVITYRNAVNFGIAIVGTVSGTSISFGTSVTFVNSAILFNSAVYDASAQKIVALYAVSGEVGRAIVGTVSGTSISFGSPVIFSGSGGVSNALASTYDAANQRIAVAYSSPTTTFGIANVIQTQSTNLTAENYIGISNAAYTNGQSATIQIVGAVDDAQSGLTPGQAYYVQPSGTLGLSPGTPSVFAGTAVSATKIIVKG